MQGETYDETLEVSVTDVNEARLRLHLRAARSRRTRRPARSWARCLSPIRTRAMHCYTLVDDADGRFTINAEVRSLSPRAPT